ncbi:MAG: serine hydrolase [Sphingomonadaceae bacterium]
MRKILLALLVASAPVAAQAPDLLDLAAARADDPVAMGWMQGTPPPPEKQITVAAGTHYAYPQFRWSFSNWCQLFPCALVKAPAETTPLEPALRTDLAGLRFRADTPGRPTLVLEDALDLLRSDGILVLHRGKVVYARTGSALPADGRHIAWSVTKSFVGLLAEAMIAEGALDAARTTASYVPELAESGWGDATVRQLLDMQTGVKFDERYGDAQSDISRHALAGGLFAAPEGYKGPVGFQAFLQTVPKAGPHGTGMTYRTADTDVLAWVIVRAAGKPLPALLEERFWKPMGMAHDALFTVDSLGTPFAGGGLTLALGDMARFGEMVRSRGMFNGRRIVPEAAVASLREGAEPAKFPAATYPTMKGWAYRSKWWVAPDGVLMARGVHGQAIWIDPASETVIARFGSHPSAGNTAFDPIALPMYRAIAARLAQSQGR